MTKVFLSGSRTLGRLNEQIRQRVKNITEQSFEVLIGDASGADKALQNYLRSLKCRQVTVYSAGGYCRNNLGDWPTRSIDAPPHAQGREFYTCKDKVMAEEADYGFVLWDGKSAGSIENVIELVKRHKKALVYLSPIKSFRTIASATELRSLLAECGQGAVVTIDNKIGLKRSLRELEEKAQTELSL